MVGSPMLVLVSCRYIVLLLEHPSTLLFTAFFLSERSDRRYTSGKSVDSHFSLVGTFEKLQMCEVPGGTRLNSIFNCCQVSLDDTGVKVRFERRPH